MKMSRRHERKKKRKRKKYSDTKMLPPPHPPKQNKSLEIPKLSGKQRKKLNGAIKSEV